MKQLISIEERAINLAQYIIDSKDTVRGAAAKFRNIKKYSTQGCNTSERLRSRKSYSTKYRN